MTIKIPEAVGWEILDESSTYVVLNTENGSLFKLQGIEAQIWESITLGYLVDDIIDEIVEDYEIARSQAQEDIFSFIGRLETHGLVEAFTTH